MINATKIIIIFKNVRFCKYKCSGNRGSCNIFYVYANNLYNPLFVFSVFGFRRRLTNKDWNILILDYILRFIYF